MFRLALILLMLDDEKAWVSGTRMEEGTKLITVRAVGGAEFEVIQPKMNEETEKVLVEPIRTIMADAA